MNKLIGILASTVVCTLAWCLVNFIALGTTANYPAVATLGVVSGIVIGGACAIFDKSNPVVIGIGITITFWLSIAAVLLTVGVGKFPAISLELLSIIAVMTAIGSFAGVSYKLAARV